MEDGPPIFNQDFSCPDLLFVNSNKTSFKYGTITLSGRLFHTILLNLLSSDNWALSLSLATTQEISVDFFSYGYLDVSVLRVRLHDLCIQSQMTLAGRVSPFRYLRINVCCRLPEAFRRLPRLSSPSTA